MNHSFSDKIFAKPAVFDYRFIEVKSFYLSLYNTFPNVNYIGNIDGERAYNALITAYGDLVLSTHTYRSYDKRKKRYTFDRTVLVMQHNYVLEFDEDYLDILHDGTAPELLHTITALVLKFKEKVRQQKPEVSLVIKGSEGLELKDMEIKRTKLDIDLYYDNDFKAVDEQIRKRLNKKADKGIVLLHGLPGTGKTTYLRYLIGKIKKRVLFLSADIAGDLMSPLFIQLLIDNPDSVIIIEDAEQIIMDRRNNSQSSVSGLLNISDGLMADFLNAQLICTFNSPLTLVDSALMRKGRLIAKYEFGKLPVEKAQRLSDRMGKSEIITIPQTLAEIANPEEVNPKQEHTAVIGFRRATEEIAG
jgi:hypothetical protein